MLTPRACQGSISPFSRFPELREHCVRTRRKCLRRVIDGKVMLIWSMLRRKLAIGFGVPHNSDSRDVVEILISFKYTNASQVIGGLRCTSREGTNKAVSGSSSATLTRNFELVINVPTYRNRN